MPHRMLNTLTSSVGITCAASGRRGMGVTTRSNGRFVSGAKPFEAFKILIDEELSRN